MCRAGFPLPASAAFAEEVERAGRMPALPGGDADAELCLQCDEFVLYSFYSIRRAVCASVRCDLKFEYEFGNCSRGGAGAQCERLRCGLRQRPRIRKSASHAGAGVLQISLQIVLR